MNYLIRERLMAHLRGSQLRYLILIGVFVGGSVLALLCVSAMPALQEKEIALYFSDFFSFIKQEPTGGRTVFLTALTGGLWDFLFCTLFAFSAIGIPFLGGYSAYKGFITGFLVSFLFRCYGLRALLFVLCGLIPHALLLIPGYLYYMAYCIRFSADIAGLGLQRQRLSGLFSSMLLFWGCIICSALLQGYIEPILLKLIAGMFGQPVN